MGKSFLRICMSSKGKPYLRSMCKPSHEQVETFVQNPIMLQNQECMKKFSHDQSLLKKCLKGEISPYDKPPSEKMELKEKLKTGFFGPDGRFYPN